jgi:hypothetical protein
MSMRQRWSRATAPRGGHCSAWHPGAGRGRCPWHARVSGVVGAVVAGIGSMVRVLDGGGRGVARGAAAALLWCGVSTGRRSSDGVRTQRRAPYSARSNDGRGCMSSEAPLKKKIEKKESQ